MKIFSRPALKELALHIRDKPEEYRARYLGKVPWATEDSLYKEREGLDVPAGLDEKLLRAAGENDSQSKAAVTLHRELIGLTPRQAGNHLFWTRLAHQECWGYMRKVIPVAKKSKSEDPDTVKKETERLRRRILSSYIVESSTRLTRHAIGKLWWFAHISFDADTGEYNETRIKTLINVKEIVERSYGRCPGLMKIVIDFISENQATANDDIKFMRKKFRILSAEKIQPMKTHWRFLLRDLNRLGANSALSAIGPDEARNFLAQSLGMIRQRLRRHGPAK